MHTEAMTFLIKIMWATEDLSGKRVLEIGSLDINGSARTLFPPGAEYVGIDRRPGPGVDWQVDARWFDGCAEFDIVITTETLEHDAEPQKIIDCAARAVKDGGLLIITAAGPGRQLHGDDGGPVAGGMFFGVIKPAVLKKMLAADWYNVKITGHKGHCDIYATAKRTKR